MRIFASYIVHYGVEWLKWSIRSVANFVDETHIFYTEHPSHGNISNLKCPETRDQLINVFLGFPETKIYWHEQPGVRYAHEGEHRTFAVNTCFSSGADTILVVDADEIWDPDVLRSAIEFIQQYPARTYRIGMRHFFRSLKYVCDDPAMPTRIIRKDITIPEEQYIGDAVGKVFHMGYAQSSEIVKYKMSIHGHKAEIRPGWFNDVFLPYQFGHNDVHPTNVDYWNPTLYEDVDGKLEHLIGDHPYWHRGIIE